MGASAAELNNMEVDSVNSSPGVTKKFPEEELTFESMKRILSPENVESRKEAEEETRMRLCETFRTASFMELVRQTQAHGDSLQDRLTQLLKQLSVRPASKALLERRETEREREAERAHERESEEEESEDDQRSQRSDGRSEAHSSRCQSRRNSVDRELPCRQQPLYETLFPELFVY